MILTFSNSKFVLHTNGARPTGSEWSTLDPLAPSYSTQIMKAAARFERHADARARNVFTKLKLRTIALPPGGVLSSPEMSLMPFQRDRGVPFILSRNRSYLAHQPGLGKSAQFISAVSSKGGRALILCPAFLITNWAREITKWSATPFPRIVVVSEKTNHKNFYRYANYILCSDAMLQHQWVIDLLSKLELRFLAADEAHRYKTQDASRTVALFGGRTSKIKSPGLIHGPEHVCFLSGTPLLNRPIELWPVLYGSAPELIDFMTFEQFGFKYGGAIMNGRGNWRFVGSTNEADLNRRIMGRFMQHIRKVEVLKDLPRKMRQVVVCDYDARKPIVKKLDQDLRRELKGGGEVPASLGAFAVVRHATGIMKAKWVALFIRNILESDMSEKILLYAHHTDVIESLRKDLQHLFPRVIKGGTTAAHRTETEDQFQTGGCRLIIGNIQAMGLGLTLTKATRVVFAEYDWTPSANEQAEDRANRIGSEWSILCQYIVLPNSLDEVVLSSVMKKQKSIGKVLGAG